MNPKAASHARISTLVESLSELGVNAPDCRRISSGLTALVAVDRASLEQAVAHLESSLEADGEALCALLARLRRPM